MIGLSILAVIFGYIFLSKFIVTKVYKSYGVKKANIALAIMILIPTWDVIFGFPIYAYLCLFEAGPKIYKTVDNVEGFYVGEKDLSSQPIEPYKGYKYIDYKETAFGRSTGKYYRSYWVDYYEDRNASTLCVYPQHPNSSLDPYTKAFNEGKCIVKKEITEGEISRWELEQYHTGTTKCIVPVLDVNKFYEMQIKDLNTQKYVGQVVNYSWKAGWIYGFFSSIETGSSHYVTSFKFRINDEKLFIQTILKPKKGN